MASVRRILALTLLLLAGTGCAGMPYADQPWLEVRTRNFWLISNAGEARSLEVAEHLEWFRSAAAVLTGAKRLEATLPTRVFVFGDDGASFQFVEHAAKGDRDVTGQAAVARSDVLD